MPQDNLTFMNDAATFLLKKKRPIMRGEQDAVIEGLLCTEAVRANTYTHKELTAQLRAASLKNLEYSPATSAFFEEMAAECERLNQLEKEPRP